MGTLFQTIFSHDSPSLECWDKWIMMLVPWES